VRTLPLFLKSAISTRTSAVWKHHRHPKRARAILLPVCAAAQLRSHCTLDKLCSVPQIGRMREAGHGTKNKQRRYGNSSSPPEHALLRLVLALISAGWFGAGSRAFACGFVNQIKLGCPKNSRSRFPSGSETLPTGCRKGNLRSGWDADELQLEGESRKYERTKTRKEQQVRDIDEKRSLSRDPCSRFGYLFS
jgi:hypothetical protein